MDQGSTKKRSAVHNSVPTVTKIWVMWEGLSFPHDTKFCNCRSAIVDRRVIFIWSLIQGSSWSGLINVGPGEILDRLGEIGSHRGEIKIHHCIWVWHHTFFSLITTAGNWRWIQFVASDKYLMPFIASNRSHSPLSCKNNTSYNNPDKHY